jgi:PAS domain S-box-containing protein
MYSVLYVDDEPSLLDIGRQFLERSGEFRIDTSISAKEALEKIGSTTYDAIVSDYQMANIDGIEFLKQVRASGNSIPFIIFTGRGREEVVIQALNEGADFYIQKGGDPKSQFIELEYKIRLAIERRQTADELSESRQRMRDIIDHLPDATVAIDLDGKVIAWNQAMEEMTGVPKEEILGTRDHSYGLPFYGIKRPILLDLVLREDKEVEEKYTLITRKGNKLISEIYIPRLYGGKGAYLWFIASPLYDRHGGITGAIESIRDITDLKRAESDLRESEERYRNVIEDQTEFICRFLPDGTHIFVNDAYCRYFGLDREEIIGTRFHPIIHPEDLEKMAGLMQSLTVDQPFMTIDQRIVMPDGSTRWQRWVDRAIFNADGTLKEYQSVGRDITENKQTEEALRSTREKYVKAFLASPDAIMISELKSGQFIEINNATSQIFGFSREEMLGKSALELGIWQRSEDREAFISHVKKKGLVERYEVVERRKSGKLFTASISADIITLNGRKHLISVVRDITGRKQMEDELRDSVQRYRNIIETTPDIIWEIDKSGIFTYVSPQSEKILGYTSSDLIGKPIYSLIQENDVASVTARFGRHSTGPGWLSQFEVSARHRDGHYITLEIHSTPFLSHDGTLSGFRGICHDITPRKQAEDALVKNEANLKRAEEIGKSGSWEFLLDENDVRTSLGARILYGLPGTRWTIDEVQKVPLPAYRPLLDTALKDLIAGKAPYNIEFKIERKSDGTIRDIHSVAEYDPARNVVFGVIHDVTEQKQVEEFTRTTLQRLDTLISRLNAGIMMVSEEGTVEKVNQAMCDIYDLPESPEYLCGLTSDEIIQKILNLYNSPSEASDRIRDLTTQGKPVIGREIPLQNRRVVLVDYIPLFDNNGQRRGRIWHHQDITDRKRAEDAIRQANRQLNLMTSITRHDINNKISVIRGYLEITRKKLADPALEEYFNRMESAVDEIQTQIEFTRVYNDLGAQEPKWEKLDEVLCMSHIPQSVALDAQVSGVEVYANPMLEKVFFNLLDNSIRHGQLVNGIKVSYRISEEGLTIIWEDDGIGIPADDKERIFERGFGRNTGLGLFLVREILALTDITIKETGTENQGSRFEIAVPEGAYRIA